MTRIIPILILMIMANGVLSEDLKNAGILKFKGKGVPASEAEGISDLFCVGLVNSHTFKVLDRANMNEILNEQAFQITGCTDEACAVKIGQLLNMDFMFTGAVIKIGTKIYITVNQIAVETGEIVKSTRTKGFLYDKLDSQIEYLVNFFTGNSGDVKSSDQNIPEPIDRISAIKAKDFGIVHYSRSPGNWTVNIPPEFTRVEIAVYASGKKEINKYGGWKGKLTINNKPAWKFVRYDNEQGGIIRDYIAKHETTEKAGKGQYLDVTPLVKVGDNTISFYHYTRGAGIGVKLRITYDK